MKTFSKVWHIIKWNLTASGFQDKFIKGGKEKTKIKYLDNKILAYEDPV